MEFTANERRIVTKALISIALGARVECLAVETRANKAFLQDTNKITFSDKDMEVGYSDHRRPLYLVASINQISIKRAVVDTSASVNLIPLRMLQATGIPKSNIQGCPMEVTGFRGRSEYTAGHIQLWLKVGPIAFLARFHVVKKKSFLSYTTGKTMVVKGVQPTHQN